MNKRIGSRRKRRPEHAETDLASNSNAFLNIITGLLSVAYPSIIRGILGQFDPVELGIERTKTIEIPFSGCSTAISVEFGMASIAGLSNLDFDGLDLLEGSMTNEGSDFRPDWKFQGTWIETAKFSSLSAGTDASLDGPAECFDKALSRKISGTAAVTDSEVAISISLKGGLQTGIPPSMTINSARIESMELGIGTFDAELEFKAWEEVPFDFKKSFEVSISDEINETINGIVLEKLNDGIEKGLPKSLP